MKSRYPNIMIGGSFRNSSNKLPFRSENDAPPMVTEKEALQLLEHQEAFIRLILCWCSDLCYQDAEDIVLELFARICQLGISRTIGELTLPNLHCNLRREKNNWFNNRNRQKRRGKAEHMGWDESIPVVPIKGSKSDPILTRSDYRLLDGYLQLILVESTGRLRILVLVMRRIMDSYENPRDLLEEMTPNEKKHFHPVDGEPLWDEELENFILRAIKKTLEQLRKRLRGLRKSIPMN